MTVVCATSGDLAALTKRIVALEERLDNRTEAVDAYYGKRVAVLEARVNQIVDGRAEYDEPVPAPAPGPAPGYADFVMSPSGDAYRVSLTGEMSEALDRFRKFRSHGWKETVSLEEALRRMLDAGLRSYGVIR